MCVLLLGNPTVTLPLYTELRQQNRHYHDTTDSGFYETEAHELRLKMSLFPFNWRLVFAGNGKRKNTTAENGTSMKSQWHTLTAYRHGVIVTLRNGILFGEQAPASHQRTNIIWREMVSTRRNWRLWFLLIWKGKSYSILKNVNGTVENFYASHISVGEAKHVLNATEAFLTIARGRGIPPPPRQTF